MRVAVCEDYQDDRLTLCACVKKYFSQGGYVGEVCAFDSGASLLSGFAPHFFDIIFLDIYMPGLSGIETAQKIRTIDRDCRIIFVTSSMDHCLDGFNVWASGYVIKPIAQGKINDALHMCRDKLQYSSRTIEIAAGREGTVTMTFDNILYVEVYGRYCMFHLSTGKLFEVRVKFDEVEHLLGGSPFLRCNKSYIVNMSHIDRISADDFQMKNGDLVPIRKNRKGDVTIAYARFLTGQPNEPI